MLNITARITVLLMLVYPGIALASKDKLLEQPWWLYEAEHFSVATNLREGGDELIRQLELFRKVALRFTGLAPPPRGLPTRAVVFAKQKEFSRISSIANELGFTRTTLRNNRMVGSAGNFDVARRQVMFHEYVHYLLRAATQRNYPAWYDEGLAELLSTVVQKKQQVLLGSAPSTHVRFLRSNTMRTPISRFVHSDDVSEWHPLQVSQFYATSWALVSYLYADPTNKRATQLETYLQTVETGKTREDAFAESFAASPRGLERRALKYANKRPKPFLRYPLSDFPMNFEIRKRRLSVAEVAYELAHLAMFRNTKLARRLLEDVKKDDPGNALINTALAVTYQADQEYVQGIALAEAALAMTGATGKPDVVSEIDLADMLMVWNREACEGKSVNKDKRKKKLVPRDNDKTCRGRYIQARAGYERALAIEPDNPEVHAGMAWALLKLQQNLDQARMHISVALGFQPWSPTLQYRAGLIHQGDGNLAAAREHLQKALYWSKDAELREDAQSALAELGYSGN
jgi:tetratricopeptide (TPR) repeat protein